MQKLKECEQKVYDFIVHYFQENGFSPTLDDICEGVYYSSRASASEMLKHLEEKGYIKLPLFGSPRAIRVVGMKHIIGDINMDQIFYEVDGRFECRVFQKENIFFAKISDSEITLVSNFCSFDEAKEYLETKKKYLREIGV